MDGERALRVLLIEDNPGDADLVVQLAEEGLPAAAFVVVSTLRAALEKLRESFDLVLADLTLPDSDGIATIERVVGALRGSPRPPVVVLTGTSRAELALDCVNHGADDFVSKSGLTPDVLRRAALFALARQRAR